MELSKRYGVNRISINPQTLNEETLKVIGRKHTVKEFYDAFKIARDAGFDNINTDLIAGLPGESFEMFKYTIEEIADILEKLAEEGTYGTILRAKGMVDGKDGEWIFFDMVPEEYELRHGEADYTGRICVIGSMLNEEELTKLFHL